MRPMPSIGVLKGKINMKLFTCGPVALYPQVQNVRRKEIMYFRTTEYGAMVKQIMGELTALLGRRDESTMIYLACSGSGAMEAAVENSMSAHDKALVINGGGFGKRFAELLAHHGLQYESLDLKWDEELSEQRLRAYEGRGFTRLFVNLDETTSGKLYDLPMLKEFCRRNQLRLIVDTISSFLVDKNDYTDVDLVLFSSQKGLCCSPGCSFISLSRDFAEEIIAGKNTSSVNMYFDFRDYFKNMERGQTPYTPTVMVMYEVSAMLELIKEVGGLEPWIDKIAHKAEIFRTEALKRGYKIPAFTKSNMLTPIYFDDTLDASQFAVKLLQKDYAVCPCGGALSSHLIRVGHAGNISVNDHLQLLDVMDEVRGELI